MASNNFVSVTGNATRDCELRFTPSGQAVGSFGVAVNRRWQNKQTSEWEESVSFFDVTVWQQLAENVAASIHKGDRLTVTGRLEQRSWEKDGVKHSKVEIVADDVMPSLRYATVADGGLVRNERDDQQGNSQGRQPARSSGSSGGRDSAPRGGYAPDEEPFRVDAGSWWPDVNLGVAPTRMLNR